jgi:hypothetical protein
MGIIEMYAQGKVALESYPIRLSCVQILGTLNDAGCPRPARCLCKRPLSKDVADMISSTVKILVRRWLTPITKPHRRPLPAVSRDWVKAYQTNVSWNKASNAYNRRRFPDRDREGHMKVRSFAQKSQRCDCRVQTIEKSVPLLQRCFRDSQISRVRSSPGSECQAARTGCTWLGCTKDTKKSKHGCMVSLGMQGCQRLMIR